MKRVLGLVLVAFFAGGCASTKMVDSSNQALPVPANDMAHVVFLRHSFVGSAYQASVFNVTSGEPEFIGILSNKKKLLYPVRPGKHVFAVVSEAADFMEAELAAGRTYYAIITPRMGAWKARFSMYPVRKQGTGDFQYDSDSFQSFLSSSQFSENTPESRAWAEANMSSIEEKYADYWAVWQEKAPADIEERTLKPDDGVGR